MLSASVAQKTGGFHTFSLYHSHGGAEDRECQREGQRKGQKSVVFKFHQVWRNGAGRSWILIVLDQRNFSSLPVQKNRGSSS